MFEVRRYTPAAAGEWNLFVEASKNGTFLFDRRFMDYHADRFSDHSLMVYRRGKLYALLPANADGSTLVSHQGLTYGGLVTGSRATAADVVGVIHAVNACLRADGFARVVYKPVPWIYHRQPAEEDLYAIFEVCGARLAARSLSSTVSADCRNPWYRIRESGARKARLAGVAIGESTDFEPFWQILADNLRQRYGIKPVHTVDEIRLLKQRFPEHIRLIMATVGNTTVAGTVLFLTHRVVHAQYIAASSLGKQLHALDLLFDVVIDEALSTHQYFDFGISTEEHGTYLNEQLIYQKEGFGGRGICYDWYEWNL